MERGLKLNLRLASPAKSPARAGLTDEKAIAGKSKRPRQLLSKDGAQRIAANIAKLPELLTR
jgi:hypothetical protein